MLHPHGDVKKIKHENIITHTIVNGFVMVIATLSPIITLPQLYRIYATQDVSGVSPITWGAYIFTSTMWFFYGFIHKERILIVNGTLGIIFGTAIFFGTVLYG